MFLEVVGVQERLVADVALRMLVGVDEEVPLEVGALGEAPLADVAHEGLVSGVGDHMVPQGLEVREALAADVARVAAFPRVRGVVLAVGGPRGEGLPTDIAHDGLVGEVA